MNYPKLPKAFKKKWTKALRSGRYKQADGVLKGEFFEKDEKNENKEIKVIKHCCLGVACEIAGARIPYKDSQDIGMIDPGTGIRGITKVPEMLVSTKDEFGDFESPDVAEKLAGFNDNGHSFEWIANWIDKNL